MNLDSCIPDVWLAVATDSVRFCGYRFFWLFTGYKAKEGEHIHDWLLYQQYHFANACSQGRNKFVIYDGDGISEWYEIIFFPRESRECKSVD